MDKLEFPHVGETLYRCVLPNGLTVLVLPRPGFQKCYAQFSVRYGGADRRFVLGGEVMDTPAGVAHFLEHKLFDTPDGGNALTAFSAAGASPNAYTSGDTTAYHFSCTENFYEHLRLLLSFVSVPYFTAESVAKEQGIIAQEIRMYEDDPNYSLYYGLLSALFAHHPLRDAVGGTVESIAQITPEVLYRCHEAFYHPSNMVLVCVGDLDAARIADLAAGILPREQREVPQRLYGETESAAAASALWERRMSVSAPQFLLGAKLSIAKSGREYLRQRLCGELALSFLVGESSPFFARLYREGLLNRDFSANVVRTAGECMFVLGGESREPERVQEALRECVRKAAERGFDEGRFDRCRKALYGDYLRTLDSFESIGSLLTGGYFNGYNFPDVFALIPTLRSEECAAMAVQTLTDERLALAVIRSS